MAAVFTNQVSDASSNVALTGDVVFIVSGHIPLGCKVSISVFSDGLRPAEVASFSNPGSVKVAGVAGITAIVEVSNANGVADIDVTQN